MTKHRARLSTIGALASLPLLSLGIAALPAPAWAASSGWLRGVTAAPPATVPVPWSATGVPWSTVVANAVPGTGATKITSYVQAERTASVVTGAQAQPAASGVDVCSNTYGADSQGSRPVLETYYEGESGCDLPTGMDGEACLNQTDGTQITCGSKILLTSTYGDSTGDYPQYFGTYYYLVYAIGLTAPPGYTWVKTSPECTVSGSVDDCIYAVEYQVGISD